MKINNAILSGLIVYLRPLANGGIGAHIEVFIFRPVISKK